MTSYYNTNICPKCQSSTNTYRHQHAKIWCPKCGFVLRDEGANHLNEYNDNDAQSNVPTPTLHKPIPLGVKVRTKPGATTESISGEVVGISFENIFFSYIVLLDTPLKTKYGLEKAVAIPGVCLEGVDGTSYALD